MGIHGKGPVALCVHNVRHGLPARAMCGQLCGHTDMMARHVCRLVTSMGKLPYVVVALLPQPHVLLDGCHVTHI